MEIRKGDYGYDINFSVKKSDGTVQSLAGTTVKFRVRRISDLINVLDGSCSVVSESLGTCKYTVQSGDFDDVGNFIGGLVLTLTGPKVISSKEINIAVSPSFKP